MSLSTKQDQVADILRERIIIGDFVRGQKLKQAELADELGVSVTPVREALLTLLAEGYVQSIPHKGLLVPDPAESDLQEVLELRLLLERELTALALRRMDRECFARLEAIQRDLSTAISLGHAQATRTHEYRFHFCLYRQAGRLQTLNFARLLWAKSVAATHHAAAGHTARTWQEHEEFLSLSRQRRPARALDVMIRHIRSSSMPAPHESRPRRKRMSASA